MSQNPTVGVEEEFLLIGADNEPAPANRAVADKARARDVALQLELTTCQVETTTGVFATSGELRDELLRLRRVATDAAKACDVRLLAIGLPPYMSQGFPVTDTPRYRRIGERFGMLAREQGVCGCHVHVEVPDRESAVEVSNRLQPWLPLLLALTANSAVYHNAETGYASWRSILWGRWPASGPPPFFDSVDHYDDTVRMLVDTGTVLDEGMIYWDVRPSAKYPTIEVRVADVPSTVAETVLLATVVRAAVMTALDEMRRGEPALRVPSDVLRAAYWKAAHDGLDGQAIDLAGNRRLVPTRRLLIDFVERIAPALHSLGEHGQVTSELARLSEEGNGAMRQLRAWQVRRDPADVIAAAEQATLA
ncbi:MAG TPA: glutamate--cysteine ligase [Mycobacterium sp.]|uniref:glutamate--cysteine ligase 2 n=1 Tax=Mycobacterium sp. TaxID=1785 RepID=UPI002D4318E7|nr:glutamate--cysteine ligase [Mycobacterium sp.]HZU49187.1 glutamate--cysteine ligase [Mycobacterium sp.]